MATHCARLCRVDKPVGASLSLAQTAPIGPAAELVGAAANPNYLIDGRFL